MARSVFTTTRMFAVVFAFCVMEYKVSGANNWAVEDGILIGTDENLQSIIRAHEKVMVKFYAPWCSHCKAMAPEYVKAAALAEQEDLGIKFVKIDATAHNEEANRHDIQGYPNLKFYKNGEIQHYDGGRNAEDMVLYLKKKCGPSAIPVDSVEEAKKARADNAVAVFGFFEHIDAKEGEQFQKFAEQSEHMFFISSDEAAAAEFGVTIPGIVVYADYEDGRSEFKGDFNDYNAVRTFVTGAVLPLTIEYSDHNSPKIFGGDMKIHMLLFVNKQADNAKETLDMYSAVATKFRGQMLFIYVDTSYSPHHRILEYFHLRTENVPAVRIVNLTESMTKFKPETTEISEKSLQEFVAAHLDGKVEEHLKSAPTPEDWDAKPLKILTGENFAQVALDNAKNVFVMFYAPWCGHCKQMMAVMDHLAQSFENNPNIVIAKMDATENEVSNVAIRAYPTLKLFPTEGEVVDFEGDRSLIVMSDWIKQKSTNVETPVEEPKVKDEL